MRIRLPVRSAIYKHDTGGLVVRWVTTSESPLLYVFALSLPFFFGGGDGRCAVWGGSSAIHINLFSAPVIFVCSCDMRRPLILCNAILDKRDGAVAVAGVAEVEAKGAWKDRGCLDTEDDYVEH